MKEKEKIKLSDYKAYPYEINNIFLDIYIYLNYVKIVSEYIIKRKSKNKEPLLFKGIGIEIESIEIEERSLLSGDYRIENNNLIIDTQEFNSFKLKIISTINPYINTSLEGLYESNNILTTQCEAEGFRRIIFHPDRPDVLSKYKVRIEADWRKYPTLLSNGNRISAKRLIEDTSRHEVIWEDPYPKPSYLFAIVAGNLTCKNDFYFTKSARKISLGIYVEPGDEEYTLHALNSLKKAMKWDEDVYGFEYDLDLYNIVAIRHFNMGAMENKGLNIFNSKLVLADSKIATDYELERVESVIAHEYFHNWTGNRITCRDWFQLSLKEGLTVYRDQSFTADLHSLAIKRIEDVSFLRSHQFLEDSGPTSHAVKPNEYSSIDNFYTTTIYEKGAEIIRMLFILLGREGFISGVKNYARKFDGQAATTEDFISALIDGAIKSGHKPNFDISQFQLWYYQSGTPSVSIDREWDSTKGSLKLIMRQNNNNLIKKPMVIPIQLSVVSQKVPVRESLLILDKEEKVFEITGLERNREKPVMSYFRDFSAPVKWNSDLTDDELFYLVEKDTNPFARWDSIQSLFKKVLLFRSSDKPNKKLEEALIDLLDRIISKESSRDLNFLTTLLTLPSISELELTQDRIDPLSLYNSYYSFSELMGQSLSSRLFNLLRICYKGSLSDWPNGVGERKLIAIIWKLLISSGNKDIRLEVLQAAQGKSMTLSLSALNSLLPVCCVERDQAMHNFFCRWKDNPIILDTWFRLEASLPRENASEITEKLLKHSLFDPLAPNSIRSILGGFVKNTKAFHSLDGKGYQFIAEQILLVDTSNPITASRLVKVFSRWKNYIEPNSHNMLKSIKFLSQKDLSTNTREVVSNILT